MWRSAAGRRSSPSANHHFKVEVTRLRAIHDPGSDRLANVIAGKLRQLPGDMPNVLVITTCGLPLSEDDLTAAARLLKSHGEQS
jgi:hypothetical protein